jgi:hypothetical protein
MRRLFRAVVTWSIVRPLNSLLLSVGPILFPTRQIGRFRVVCIEEPAEELLNRVEQALSPVQRLAPWVHYHLGEDISSVHIRNGVSGFQVPGRAMLLSPEHVNNESIEYLAARIVFSATSARLETRVRGSIRKHGFRVLRSSLEAQLRFVKLLPTGEQMAQNISNDWDQGWWNVDDRSEALQRLKKTAVPAWIRAGVAWVYDVPSDE